MLFCVCAFHGPLVGSLAGWGIAKTPKAFLWTIANIRIRPSFSLNPDMWSEIVVSNWTWHNPAGFEDDIQSFVLRIDRMTVRLELASLIDALRFKRAVNVNLVLFEGVHLKTRRNAVGELNLWAAINEPDQDTNINAIWSRARAQGGLDGGSSRAAQGGLEGEGGGGAQGSSPKKGIVTEEDDLANTLLQPLPAVSTSATRKAARYWRPEWGTSLPLGEKCSWMWGDLMNPMNPIKVLNTINPMKRSMMMTPQALALELYLIHADDRKRPVRVTASGGSKWDFANVDDALAFLANFTDEDDCDDEGNGIAKGYVEFPIGDPQRRARWGVPLRLDIQQLVALNLRVELFDLLTLNAHNSGMYAWMWGDVNVFGLLNPVRWSEYRTAIPLIADLRRESADCPNRPVKIKGRDFADIMAFENVEMAVKHLQRRAAESGDKSDDSKTIDVKYLTVDRDRLEQGDPRRSGSDDNVHGVYLSELVWVIIAMAVPIILKGSPSALMRNAISASAYGAKDASVRATALALEGLHTIGSTFGDTFGFRSVTSPELCDADCRLQVHLIKGRKIRNRNGHRVNILAKLAITEPGALPGEHASRAVSSLKLWTMDPSWGQRFELGPVTFACCSLRLALFHRRTKQFAKLEERIDDKIGEIVVSLLQLLGSEQTIGEDGERVGWFPITPADDSMAGEVGEVKLGLRLVNATFLPDLHKDDHSECAHTVSAAKEAAQAMSFLGASQVLSRGGAAYSWMWGDARSLAHINPVRWSDWNAPERLAEKLSEISDPQERQRPVRVRGKQRGHWTFSTVPMAVEWLKSSGTSTPSEGLPSGGMRSRGLSTF